MRVAWGRYWRDRGRDRLGVLLKMRALIGLVAIFAFTSADASVSMENDPASPYARIIASVRDEPLSPGAWATIGPTVLNVSVPSELGQFLAVWACANADGSNQRFETTMQAAPHSTVYPEPTCDLKKLVGTWGRDGHGANALIQQEIVDKEVRFIGDYACDGDIANYFSASGVHIKRAYTYCAPKGLATSVAFRLEARKSGGGFAQINIRKRCTEGSTDSPAMDMRTQCKGASTADGGPVSCDDISIPVLPDSNEYCILVSAGEGVVLFSGYRLQ